MPTWKKILLEGDTIPATSVQAGAFGGSGGSTFPGPVATDTVNEETSGSGVTVDSVLLKDGEVHMQSGKAESISRAWMGV